MALSPLLQRYDHVILDLDGCVWVGGEVTPRAPEAIAAIRDGGKTLAFVTNDGRLSPEEYVRKLWSVGCTASLEEVVTVGSAIQFVLAEHERPLGVYVIGAAAVFRHVAEAGHRVLNHTPRAEAADMVVVVSHDEISYGELTIATRAVLGGATILCGGLDRTYPTRDGPSPGTGAIVAAIEYATGAVATSVGKPEPQMFQTALDRFAAGTGGRAGRTLVVGDRLDSDLAGAVAASLDGAIVLSGSTTAEQAAMATDPAPVAVAANLGVLVLGS